MSGEFAERISLVSKRLEDTLRMGRVIGERAMPGMVVALIGDLGAGKTSLAQGIAAGLRVPHEYYVTSPTFTLINEYPGRLPLYHFDVYRLSGSADLEDLGYEDYFYGDGLVVVEWAEKLMESLPGDTLFIRMDRLDDESRKIELSCRSSERLAYINHAFKEGGIV